MNTLPKNHLSHFSMLLIVIVLAEYFSDLHLVFCLVGDQANEWICDLVFSVCDMCMNLVTSLCLVGDQANEWIFPCQFIQHYWLKRSIDYTIQWIILVCFT